jgi:O-antigen/teichoic acid export membrane protein
MMATTVITAATGGVFWLYAARTATPHQIGLATALVAAMSVTSLIADLGIRSTLVQVLGQKANGRAWSAAVNAGLLIGTGSGLAFGAVVALVLPRISSHFGGLTNHPIGFIFLGCGVAAAVVATDIDYVFVAERQAWKMFTRNSVFSLVRFPIVVILGWAVSSTGWTSLFGAWILATVISCGAGVALFRRLGRGYTFTLRDSVVQVRDLGAASGAHHLINLGGALPALVLPLLVTARLSASANAYFYVTWMMCSIFYMVSPAIAVSLFAEGARARTNSREAIRRSARLISVLIAPTMVVYLVAGHWLLGLFGPAYALHGETLLLLLVGSAVPDAATNIYISRLRVQRRLSTGAALNIGMGIFTLVGSWLLMPAWGIAAPGACWLGAQVLGTLFCVADAAGRRERVKRRSEQIGSAAVFPVHDA